VLKNILGHSLPCHNNDETLKTQTVSFLTPRKVVSVSHSPSPRRRREEMIVKCSKCGQELNSEKGQIIVISPVYFKGAFLTFYLCRSHFLESDSMNSVEFRKWIHNKEK
jgi:hypothetical protein